MTVSSELMRQHYTINSGVRTLPITFPFQDGTTDIRVIVRAASGTETELAYGSQFTVVGTNVIINALYSPWTTNDTVAIFLDPPLTQSAALPNSGAFNSESVEDALDKHVNMQKRSRDLADRSLHLTDGSYIGVAGNYDAENLRISNVGAPTADNDAATKSSVAAQIAASILTPSITVSAAAATVLDDATTDLMLTSLGGGTKGVAVFKGATVASILGTLNVSSYMQDRLTDTDAIDTRFYAEVSKYDELPVPNLLLNGDFQIWQQGVTFNSTTPVAGGNNDNVYFADQWVLLSNGNNIVSIGKAAAGSAGSNNAASFTQVSADTKWGVLQILDSARSVARRSQNISLAVDVQATGSLTGFRVALLSWAGAADAPTRDVVSAWGAATTQFTPVANWTIVSEASITATASYATFKLENVTVPAGCNNLAVFVYTNDSSFSAGAVVNMTAMMLVDGAWARTFRARTLSQELRECERFFQKTFPLETYPIANTGQTGALHARTQDEIGVQGALSLYWQFRQRMRIAPTVTTYNPNVAANVNWRNTANTVTKTVVAVGASENGVLLHAAPAGGTSDIYAIHASADARF